MKRRRGWISVSVFTLLLVSSLVLAPRAGQKMPAEPQAKLAAKPKIRALTAFIHLDRAQVQNQVADVLSFLRKLKAKCEEAGYEVEIACACGSSAAIIVFSALSGWRVVSARLLPVAGKKAGEPTEFDDPFLVNATLQPSP